MLTVGSMFSGIGGMDLGLERAGMKIKWQAEVDPYCCEVLKKHWPMVPNLGDVKLVEWEEVERVDLVCGGFPCQPVSTAGRRLGQDDERWLWPQVVRAVRVLRPDYVIVENVPGLLARGMGDVLGDLADLGYDAEWQGIPAAAVGAPHLRWRIFIVAHSERVVLRHEPGRWDGPRWSGPTVTRHDGEAWDVADTDDVGLQGSDEPRVLSGVGAPGHQPSGGGAEGGTGHWTVEPDVGVRDDGISSGLDGVVNADAEEGGPGAVLPGVRDAAGAEAVQRPAQGPDSVPTSSLLRSGMHGSRVCQRHRAAELEASQGVAIPWEDLRVVWGYDESARPPHRRERQQRLTREHPDLVQELSRFAPPPCSACWADGSWESGLARVATGVPSRVDRLRGLGNAVVPQVAEWVGRRILEAV